jgi:hypothetical protein
MGVASVLGFIAISLSFELQNSLADKEMNHSTNDTKADRSILTRAGSVKMESPGWNCRCFVAPSTPSIFPDYEIEEESGNVTTTR